MAGWVVAVMIEVEGERAPLRHYFAVGYEDQGKAEWTAVDEAMSVGPVATSPIGGEEPVQAVRRLTPQKMAALGLAPREVRPLGWNWPRRWMT